MTIEEKLKELIISRHGTMREFVQVVGLPYSTIDTILRRGVNKASITNVIAICKALHISADELAAGRIVPVGKPKPQTAELGEIVEKLKLTLSNFKVITVNGTVLSADEIQTFSDGIDFAYSIVEKRCERR